LLTPSYRSELQGILGKYFRDAKVHVIPNGIDIDRFKPAESFGEDGKNVVRLGMAARFSDTKRQDLLIDLLVSLREHSHIDYRLSLAGDGETRRGLMGKAREMGVEEYVDFPGYLDEDKLLEWFRTIDIYLHGSEGETLSTSLLQAMSMGLPIVASDIPGITNLLHQSKVEYGLLADNNDLVDFSKKIKMIVHNSELRMRLSESARKVTEDLYSNDIMFVHYNRVIEECLKK